MSSGESPPPAQTSVPPVAALSPVDNPRTAQAVLLATILASAMVFIDGAVVNLALPSLQAEFDAQFAGLQWVVESYLVALTALVMIGGALGDRFGRRRMFAVGTAVFALASLLCGLAPTLDVLLVARILQGVGGALLVPGSLAIITSCFEPGRRGKAIGTWSAFSAIATAAAPMIGGAMVEAGGWRWIFFINLPPAALVLWLALRMIPESRDASAGARLDWPGAVLAALGLGLLVFGLVEGGRLGFDHVLAWPPITLGTVFLIAFVGVEGRSPAPMMPLDLFRHRAFAATCGMTVLLYGGMSGILFFLPLHLMQVVDYSPTMAGFSLLPFALLIGALSRHAGGLVDRYGVRLPLTVGPIVAGLGVLALAVPGTTGSYWTTFLPGIAILGVGMGLSVAPLTTAVMNAAPPAKSGLASGISNALSRLGTMLAVAILGAIAVTTFAPALADQLDGLGLDAPGLMAILGADVLKLAGLTPPGSLAPVDATLFDQAVDAAALDAFRAVCLVGAAMCLAAGLVSAIALGPKGTNRYHSGVA